MSIDRRIEEIHNSFKGELEKVNSSKEAEDLKVRFLGKKGLIQGLMPFLKDATKETRPLFGKQINTLKLEITSLIEKHLEAVFEKEQNKLLNSEKIDVTLPGRQKRLGGLHVATIMKNRMIDILVQMGFSVQLGPDVDSDYYNFEALNFSKNHPARDMQDTFYLTKDLLLRTHTSNVQVRVMEKNKPPIRVIAPGKCFRNETISSRSHVFFHQIEAFYVDENVSFSDLLSTLDQFHKKLLGNEVKTRVRPSYFPFVEPGMEVDISCFLCKAKGCRICKHTGWLETGGAGMIHPNVLKYGNIDPEKYSGFAWGLGVERLAMLEYGIEDIRSFTNNDMRLLNQFN
jgi:phenylalanyl-tRNA synthetase alpha chain